MTTWKPSSPSSGHHPPHHPARHAVAQSPPGEWPAHPAQSGDLIHPGRAQRRHCVSPRFPRRRPSPARPFCAFALLPVLRPVSAPICLPWLYLFPTVGNEINVLRIPGLWGINRISSAFLQKGCQEKLHSTREEIRGIVSGESESESRSVASDSLRPHGLSPWNSPGQNIGVGSLSLLQGIFPTEGSNPGLPHCRQILYQLSHKGSPRILKWVAYPFFRGSSRPRNPTGVSCIADRFFTNSAMREAHMFLHPV